MDNTENAKPRTLAQINESGEFLKKLRERTGIGSSVRKILEKKEPE